MLSQQQIQQLASQLVNGTITEQQILDQAGNQTVMVLSMAQAYRASVDRP